MANRTDTESVINLVINGKQAMTSLRELTDTQRRLNSEMRNMRPNDPGYPARLRELQMINTAMRQQRAEMQGLNTESDKLKHSWSDMASVAGGNLLAQGIQMASGAISNFIAGSQAAYSEAEQGQAQLQAVLKSTGNVAGQSKGHLDDLAQSLMNLTGVDDDVITKSESLLLTFTNVRGEIFDRTLPAIVDMTAALNNGNVSMETIQGTTIQVGKALNDPIKGMTALRKVGVSFTEDQIKMVKSMVATNDVAGAQKIILDELSKEFGGVGKALGETETGAMQKFQTRLGNIQEALGGFIVKGKASMSQVLAPLVGWLERATETKLSETLDRDRISLASNLIQLQASNTSHETRVGIIKKLKEQYPAYLEDIDAEKVSNGKLLPVLHDINKALVMRIAFQKKNEALNDAMEDEAEAFLKQDKAATQLSQTMAAIMDRAKDKGLNIVIPKNLTDLEQADYLVRKLNEAKRDGTGINIKMNVNDLKVAQQNLMQLQRGYADAGEESAKLLEAQTSFASKYKLNGKGETEEMERNNKPPVASTIYSVGGSKTADKEKEAAKKLADELGQLSEELYQNSLEKIDKEVEAIRVKYEKLRELAKGNKDRLVEIANLEGKEMLQLYSNQSKEELEIARKKGEELAKKAADEAQNRKDAITKVNQGGLSGPALELAQADEHYKELILLAEKYGLDTTEVRKQWSDARKRILDDEIADEKTKQQQKHQDLKDTAISAAESVTSAIFAIGANARQAETNANLSKIDQERQNELSNKNLTEEQKNKINKKYDDKVRAEKLRAWKADQRAALSQAVISGALAVVKALPNIFASVAAGIAAAAQIAVIASQKPPEFGDGVRDFDGGLAIVGERGPEAIEENGRTWIANKPTLTMLEPGANVYTAGETRNMKKSLGETLYPQANYSIDSSSIRKAEMSYRSAGQIPASNNAGLIQTENQNTTKTSGNFNTLPLENKLDDLITAVGKGFVFDYKGFEEFKAKIDDTRNSQSG